MEPLESMLIYVLSRSIVPECDSVGTIDRKQINVIILQCSIDSHRLSGTAAHYYVVVANNAGVLAHRLSHSALQTTCNINRLFPA